MFQEFILPNGKVAESNADIDAYLRESGAVLAGDYGAEYIKNAQYKREKAYRAEMFDDFVQEYKKRIWNE